LTFASAALVPARAQSPGTNWVEESGCYIIRLDLDPRIEAAEAFLVGIQYELEKLTLSATRKVVEKLAGVPRSLSVGFSVFLGIIFNSQLVGGGIPDYSHGEVVALIDEGRAATANAEAETEYAICCYLEVGAQVDVPRHLVLETKSGLFTWTEIARWELLTPSEAQSLSPYTNPMGNRYLLVSKDLIAFPTPGTYRLSYSTGRTMQVAPKSTFATVSADLSASAILTTAMTVQTAGMEFNSYGACWRMVDPGCSYLQATFNVAQVPSSSVLSLSHLSSADCAVQGGGYSPVDIYVNGELFRDNYDVAESHCGAHGYAFDQWNITGRLVSGVNIIRIELQDNPRAETHYWLQALHISSGTLPLEPDIRSFLPSPSTVTIGDTFQLLAGCVRANPNATISTVEFWRDANGNGVLDAGSDEFLGSGSNLGGDWIWLGKATFPFGGQRFFCRACDTAGNWSAPESSFCNIVAAPAPALTSASLSPGNGTTSQAFAYQVSYYDSSGLAPLQAHVYVDGAPFMMTRISGTDANGTYTYTKSNFTPGAHSYQFAFRSGGGVEVRLPQTGSFSGPTVETPGGAGGDIHVDVWWYGGGTSSSYLWKGGVVEPSISGDVAFRAGDALWLTAYPDFGWRIGSWEMRYNFDTRDWVAVDSVAGNSALMYVREPIPTPAPGWQKWIEIRGVFQREDPAMRVLTINTVGPGQVSPDDGAYLLSIGSPVTVIATPHANARFVEWQLDGATAGTELVYTVVMDGDFDKTLTAIFNWNSAVPYTVDLPCIADATIEIGDMSDNVGSSPGLDVRFGTSQIGNVIQHDVLLKFDVALLPLDAVISDVEVHIWCDDLPTRNIGYELQGNLDNWSEEQIAQQEPRRTSLDWGWDEFRPTDDDIWHVIPFSQRFPEVLQWVLQWRAGSNYGIRIRPLQAYIDDGDYYDKGGTDSTYNFVSRENADTLRRPFLRVTYLGQRLAPTIATDSAQVIVQATHGTSPTQYMLSIRNGGEGILNYTACVDADWLTLTGEASGTCTNDSRQLALAFDSTELPAGFYQAVISITDTNASNSPYTVPVFLTVLGPAISASTASIIVTAAQGVNPTPTTLEVWNSGYGTLDFSVFNSSTWITATPASGTSTGQVQQVTLRFATAALNSGVYQDTMVLTDSTGDAPPVAIPVTLTVLSVVATPTFDPLGDTAYLTNVSAQIYCATPGATIRYTLDGSSPIETSPQYTGTPIVLTSTTVVRAKAWKEGMLPSPEQVSSFTILTLPPTLGFSRKADGLVFTWPTSEVGFVLEYATNVPTTHWIVALPLPSVVGEQNVVTNAITSNARFYRLRR